MCVVRSVKSRKNEICGISFHSRTCTAKEPSTTSLLNFFLLTHFFLNKEKLIASLLCSLVHDECVCKRSSRNCHHYTYFPCATLWVFIITYFCLCLLLPSLAVKFTTRFSSRESVRNIFFIIIILHCCLRFISLYSPQICDFFEGKHSLFYIKHHCIFLLSERCHQHGMKLKLHLKLISPV